jgi:DNA-binding IclR family transcriptional regulator
MAASIAPAHAAQIAQRIDNARSGFVAICVEQHGMSPADAGRALDHLVRIRVARLDVAQGRYNLKHGAYWDAAVLRRAATAA